MSVKADLVSGILPVREDGRVLLLLRPKTQTSRKETWEPPAGRLVPGESFETGAVRELYEETGLLVAPQLMLATWVGERPGGEVLASVTYIGRTAKRGVRLTHEHLDYRWTTLDEWLSLPSWWSPQNIRRVAGPLSRLPREPAPEPPAPEGDRSGVLSANLGAGLVLATLNGEEPRALLLRRRKPPAGLWENPGGMLETGEDFVACARREAFEETGIRAKPELPWWARIEPWRGPDDPELYAGVGFVARCRGGVVRLEDDAHDALRWVTEAEWRSARTWYTERESDRLWAAIRRLDPRRAPPR